MARNRNEREASHEKAPLVALRPGRRTARRPGLYALLSAGGPLYVGLPRLWPRSANRPVTAVAADAVPDPAAARAPAARPGQHPAPRPARAPAAAQRPAAPARPGGGARGPDRPAGRLRRRAGLAPAGGTGRPAGSAGRGAAARRRRAAAAGRR